MTRNTPWSSLLFVASFASASLAGAPTTGIRLAVAENGGGGETTPDLSF